MSVLTKEIAVKIIVKCAELYKKNLLNKTILFIATGKHKNVMTLEVTFKDSNFLHLTGVKLVDQSLSASQFYKRCIAHKLSKRDFYFPDGIRVQNKLSVMPDLFSPNLSANSIGEYNGYGLWLHTDKLAGNVRGCIGFVKDSTSKCMLPNTLLREDIRTYIKQPLRVVATYSKDKSDEIYSKCVYKAKKVDWERIKFPQEYEYLYTLIIESNL